MRHFRKHKEKCQIYRKRAVSKRGSWFLDSSSFDFLCYHLHGIDQMIKLFNAYNALSEIIQSKSSFSEDCLICASNDFKIHVSLTIFFDEHLLCMNPHWPIQLSPFCTFFFNCLICTCLLSL